MVILGTVLACKIGSAPDTAAATGVLLFLPEDVDGYEGESGGMGEKESEWLPEDTEYLRMTYREIGLLNEADKLKQQGKFEAAERYSNYASFRALQVTLLVAGADSRSLHRPAVCLPGQGWKIVRREVVKLQTTGGPLEVMDFHLEAGFANEDGSPRLDENGEPILRRAHYIYWWVGPDDSTPYDERRVFLELWNSTYKGKRERWAYPSVMVYVEGEDPVEGRAKAQERAYDYIQKHAPQFQISLGASR